MKYCKLSVINVMAKIFSLALRNSLNNWCESENVFKESQFGFRNSHRTTVFTYYILLFKIFYTKNLNCNALLLTIKWLSIP